MKHGNSSVSEVSGAGKASLGRRLLSVTLAVAMVFSGTPTGALNALAEELSPEDPQAEELVELAEEEAPSEAASAEEPAPDEAAPAPEEEPAPAAGPTSEPTSGPESEPAAEVEPEPEPEPEVTLSTPQTVDTLREQDGVLGTPVPSGVTVKSSTQLFSEEGDKQLADGIYTSLTFVVTVTAAGVSATDYPTLTLGRSDAAGNELADVTYTLNADTWAVISGQGQALVHVSAPGIYTAAAISGVVYSGGTLTNTDVSLSPSFSIAGAAPMLADVTLLADEDAPYEEMRDASNNVIDLAKLTTATTYDAEAIKVRVSAIGLDAASSKAILYGTLGSELDRAAFEPETRADGTVVPNSYIAVLDGSTYEGAATLPEGIYYLSVWAQDLTGEALKDAETNQPFVVVGGKIVKKGVSDYKVESGELILIDRGAPYALVDYPRNVAFHRTDLETGYTPDADAVARQDDYPDGIDFFNAKPQLEITIKDLNLDKDATTVFGAKLSALIANPEGAIDGASCTVGKVTMTSSGDLDPDYARGVEKYHIVATFDDGIYAAGAPVVAKDATHEAVTEGLSFDGHVLTISHFVVDTTAPEVTRAELSFGAFELGQDANGNALSYGADGNGNNVYFVGGDRAENALNLTIKEPFGIRSVEMVDPSDTYANYLGGFNEALENGNADLAASGHGDTYNLGVVDTLIDGMSFPDDIKFVITDFAGNQYTWSLKEQGTTGKADGTTASHTNADLWAALGGNPMEELKHPTLLVPDDTEPVLVASDIPDRANAAKAGYERYFDADQTLSLSLTEANLHYLLGFEGGGAYDPNSYVSGSFAGLDPSRTVLTYTFTADAAGATPETRGITVSDLQSQSVTLYTLHEQLSEEGDYANIQAAFKDVAQHSASTTAIKDFTIDKTAPQLTVTFDNNDEANGGYYKAPRTATIEVLEHNFDPELFSIDVTAGSGAAGLVTPTPSAWSTSGDTHSCTVAFTEEGTYLLTVSGKDKAGNEASPYFSGTFAVDTEAPVIAQYYVHGTAPAASFDTDDPVVELPEPTGTFGGTAYYTHAISVDAKVQDRNLDLARLTLAVSKDGTETTQALAWQRTPDEVGPNGRELYQASVPYMEDGEYLAPHVVAADYANNGADNVANAEATRFVLDLKAPTVAVSVDKDPSNQEFEGSDPYNFYNASTIMTIQVSDEHLLRSVELADPSNQYTVTASEADAEGKGSVTLTVTLKDGAGDATGVFDRDITLSAEDLAGNTRTWNISPTGSVSTAESAANASVHGDSLFPLEMIQDTVAPVVSLAGATAGTYYNAAQTVTADIYEYCMDYVQRFDADRVVVTVTTRAGQAGASTQTYTIGASDFSGSRPTYSHAEEFSGDGHYSLSAQLTDMAGNVSNTASIGEFTIDMTDPVIDVSWDNNDVRNGKYYKATRTATITVTEHNFDASLISVDTTGSMSGWSTSGDTHVCTVFFGEGSAHTLKVGGTDLAGNKANDVEEDEFVVDLTAPEIEIAGTAQRLGYLPESGTDALVNAYHGELQDKSAYNGVVVPTITYKDNEPLSSADLSYALAGSKNGDDLDPRNRLSDEAKEMTRTFEDLGYVGPGAPDGSNWDEFYVDDYAPGADDIYTLTAKMTDQAGNVAEAELVFSVNRYGSNYAVELLGLSADEAAEYEATGVLSEPPTIMVREVNVSGVADTDRDGKLVGDNHHVQKEFANATSAITLAEGSGAGYGLVSIPNREQEVGWSEYVYTIRSANFGEGSDSDNNDRGQGLYRVNVSSDDTSSNANSTAAYWSSDAKREAVDAAGATTEFVLDELAPVIDDLDLPEHLSAGEAYEASFHVTDDITSGNEVQVFVDGRELGAGEVTGPRGGVGTYSFKIPARSFNWSRDVRIVVTDYAGRAAEATNGTWIWQSRFIAEGVAAAGAVAACAAGVVAARRRKAAEEPELPA